MAGRIDKAQIKANRSYQMRYKRPALASLGYHHILDEYESISDAVYSIRYFAESNDGRDTLLNALDGDDEAEWEFLVAFSDLSAKAEDFYETLDEVQQDIAFGGDFAQYFDDHLVALIGNRYNLIGAYQDVDDCEDYASLMGYEASLAYSEAGKRVMRRTKKDMLTSIGQCLGILISFLDLRQRYDYLKATFDILRDENTSLLQTIKQIDQMYAAAMEKGGNSKEMQDYDRVLSALPDRAWIE